MYEHCPSTNDEAADDQACREIGTAPFRKCAGALMDGSHDADQGQHGDDLQQADHGRQYAGISESRKDHQHFVSKGALR